MPERDIVAYCNGLSKAEFWSLGMGDVQNLLDEALEEIERLRVALDEAQLRSIEASNPGIDMDEVRRVRKRSDG